jgi:hypothetical protein
MRKGGMKRKEKCERKRKGVVYYCFSFSQKAPWKKSKIESRELKKNSDKTIGGKSICRCLEAVDAAFLLLLLDLVHALLEVRTLSFQSLGAVALFFELLYGVTA